MPEYVHVPEITGSFFTEPGSPRACAWRFAGWTSFPDPAEEAERGAKSDDPIVVGDFDPQMAAFWLQPEARPPAQAQAQGARRGWGRRWGGEKSSGAGKNLRRLMGVFLESGTAEQNASLRGLVAGRRPEAGEEKKEAGEAAAQEGVMSAYGGVFVDPAALLRATTVADAFALLQRDTAGATA